MPYDKDGKYYRLPTNSINKGKPDEGKNLTANEIKAKKNIEQNAKELKQEFMGMLVLFIIFLTGIIGGCVYIFNNVNESAKEPDEFNSIYARVYCADLIKDKLKDPSSYKVYGVKILGQSGAYNQYGAATIDFGAKNSFGGMVRRTAKCLKYNENGTDYLRVNILP